MFSIACTTLKKQQYDKKEQVKDKMNKKLDMWPVLDQCPVKTNKKIG